MELTDEWDDETAADRPVTGGGYGPPSGPWAPFDRPQSAPPASGPPAAGRGGFMPSGRRGLGPRAQRPPADAADYGDDYDESRTGRLETGPTLRRSSMPEELDGPMPDRPGFGPGPGRGRPSS